MDREAYLMGTVLRVQVAADSRAAALGATERAFETVRRFDDLMSTWRDDSEITRLNRAPVGHAVQLSDTLYGLLREADRWSRATGGAFDPGVGAFVDLWDLRGKRRVPSAAELERGRGAAGIRRFVFDDARRTVTRTVEGAWLDTGGFGKGAALRAAAAALAGAGIRDAALNFGGQLLVIGRGTDGAPWPVPVARPSARTRPAALLRASDRSVSTSSQSERPSHILDPRTGRPVPAWGSVTVVAADPAVADMLSTALFVMGPEAGLAWARGRTDIGVLFLVEEREGRLRRRWNTVMRTYLSGDVVSEFVTDSPSTDSMPGG